MDYNESAFNMTKTAQNNTKPLAPRFPYIHAGVHAPPSVNLNKVP